MSSGEHFDCHYCKDSLLGKKYIMKEDTQYCTKCYDNLFANCCEGCSLPIGCNCKVKTSECFMIPATCKAYYIPLFVVVVHTSHLKHNNFKLLIYRTCPTRIVIGMTSVSNVPSAAAHWWKKHLQPRMIYCCAPNVTPMIIPPNATTARKPSCQVCLRTIKSHPLRKFSNSSSQGEWQGGLQQTDGLKPS